MSIVEQNELIAVFDGWQRVGSKLVKHSEREVRKPEHLFYHAHWAWLMPVCHKFCSLIHFDTFNGVHHDRDPFYAQRVTDLQMAATTFDIERLYPELVKCIIWYNQQTTSPT